MIRSLLSVGGFTLISRITGFVRDIVLATFLGAGMAADAFVVAQRLPNHFRAIFGEGAFNAAFVPSYSRELTKRGSESAQVFAGRTMSILATFLAVLSVVAIWQMPLFIDLLAPGFSNDQEKYLLAISLTRITFPYLFFVSIVTLLSGVLNAHDRFAAAAAAPILLNFSVISALMLSFFFPSSGHAAAWGITVAGILELVLLLFSAKRAGCLPVFRWPVFDMALRGFFKTLGPAVIGSGGIQIAMFADTILASLLPTGSVSAIYYADRIYQLPIGIIGIAAGTVLLPIMSRHISSGNAAEAERIQNRTVGLTFAMTVPFLIAFLLIPDLILDGVFLRGAFTKEASSASASVLSAYALGLVPIMLLRPVSAGFLARQDTLTPLIASLSGMLLNVVLKFFLYRQFGAVGLAFATAMGAWCNFGILIALAVPRHYLRISRSLLAMCSVAVGASIALLIFTHFLSLPIVGLFSHFEKWGAVLALVTIGTLGAGVYGVGFFILQRFVFRVNL